MNRCPQPAIDHSYRLVPLLAVDWAERRKDEVALILEHLHAEEKWDAVLATIRLVLGGIEIDDHPPFICDSHSSFNRRGPLTSECGGD